MLCRLYSIISFSFLVEIVSCQFVSLQALTPINYRRDKLRFACTPSSVGTTDVISDITLQKNSSTAWLDVVKVYLDSSTGQFLNKVTWTDINMSNRASVNLSVVSPTTGAGLRIEISADRVACNDEGNYRCSISGSRAVGGKLDSQSAYTHVGMLVQASSIDSIRVYPPAQIPDNTYNPGLAVSLTCTGDVGNPAGDLRWCIRREGIDISFTGYPNSADIIQEPASLSGCQYRRTSKLTYNVSSNIPEVDFRCETGPMATCGLSHTLAANFTLIRYTESTNKGAQSSSDTADDGIIAIVIIGSFIGVVIIVISIYIDAFRKTSSCETYRTREENGTSAASIDNLVFSLPQKDRNSQQKHTALGSSISYENEISRIPDLRQTVAERSYESLVVKGMTNGYEQLTKENDINSTYQTLGEKEKPNVYEQLPKEIEINSTYQTLGEKEKPNEYEQLPKEIEISSTYQILNEKEKPNEYDDLSNQSDLRQTVAERSYESLVVKGMTNGCEQLTKKNDINSTYQTLGEKEKPNVYEQLPKEIEIYSTYQILSEKEKPNEYDDLSNQSVLDEYDEYVNVNI